MSWIKKRGQNATPSPAPEGQAFEPVQMYNPNMANQWQTNSWYQQQQHHHQEPQNMPFVQPFQQNSQSYWELSGGADQQTNQQSFNHSQQYQNQNQYSNSSQLQSEQHNLGNVEYNQQYNTQNNSFQSGSHENSEVDTWGNWGWGDEDNSNVQNIRSKDQLKQPKSADLTASFTNDESWNWTVEEPSKDVPQQPPPPPQQTVGKDPIDLFPTRGKTAVDGSASGNDQEKISSISQMKRNKLETPQWSLDSQVSQESSDDILQTSESDNHLISSSSPSGLENFKSESQQLENRQVMNEIPPAQAYSDDSWNKLQKNVPSSKAHSQHAHSSSSSSHPVNLETVPDNSEQPGIPEKKNNWRFNQLQTRQLDNNPEMCMNDRNQYLETGQLSDVNQQESGNEALQDERSVQEDTLPPPGLRRMVLGQLGQQENDRNVGNFNEEPPPGLSRMVLGQNENNPSSFQLETSFEPMSPPEGLRRMVPGESSSPETSLNVRQSAAMFQSENVMQRADNSDMEFNRIPQLRSETIGADMPPPVVTQSSTAQSNIVASSNRSETIGAPMPDNKVPVASVSPGSSKRSSNRKPKDKTENQRRDYIDGESELSAGMRNLTVGENSTDEVDEMEPSSLVENRRKQSRQDSSESENERVMKTQQRDGKKDINRYKSDRRERDEYSPDRDRRYDRKKYRDRHRDDAGDFFSDGEQKKPPRESDHDKKYYSLKKDKERDRRRRESPREYEKDRRKKNDYYRSRYEDSYQNEERSRPSSRSDSMHNSSSYGRDRRMEKEQYHQQQRGRDRPRDRDRRDRRPRDSYNSYGGYNYDHYGPYYQQYQYQYYENLARTNPQAYAEIYRKYYEQHSQRHPPGYGHDDRSSVHSGRSSANEEQKDRYSTRQSYYSQSSMTPYNMSGYYHRDSKANSISGHYDLDESSISKVTKDQPDSYMFDDTKMGRVTPSKFTTAHVKASIGSGKLVKILPNYPQDGQQALVELIRLENHPQQDDEFKELAIYPGPLSIDATHKKTVIEYCENKIRNVSMDFDISDPDSYILLWKFLILLLRQNGKVVGSDIAELLLKNRENPRPPSGLSNLSSTTGDIPPISESSNPQNSEMFGGNSAGINMKVEDITNKFREYLLYGSDQEALEWAMKNGLWGHALFLASKLGKRTYSNVMVRFANGLTLNDPLQTLYQLLSGRMPASVAGVADEKWGDWKPHLAMMLSNSSLQPELNRKAITALGDTLMVRGSLYAAQFCYLMAEIGFGRYGNENVKLVLLGSNHLKPFSHFATNESIHMTEIYEYACSLNDPQFALPELQSYKCLLARRLADRGFLEKSLAYLEKISLFISRNPTRVQSSLINNVYNLADKLKYYDPIGVEFEDENTEIDGVDNRPDGSWLKNLRTLRNDVNAGLITSEIYPNDDLTLANQTAQDSWQQQSSQQIYQYQDDGGGSQQWQSEQSQLSAPINDVFQQKNQQLEDYSASSYEDQQQQFWSNQQPQQHWNTTSDKPVNEQPTEEQQTYYGALQTHNEFRVVNKTKSETEEGKPSISIPNQAKGKSYYDDEPLPHERTKQNKKAAAVSEKRGNSKQNNSSGWFGGIFSKLGMKSNQMKLPDDKNPSIVWDQEKKLWVNLDEDNNVASSEFKPPPKLNEMKPLVSAKPPIHNNIKNDNISSVNRSQINSQSYAPSNNSFAPPNNDNLVSQTAADNTSQNANNMFKLQRNRNLKKSYVDVFNPGGGVSKPTVAPLALSGMPQPSQMNFFVPQPVNDPNAPTNFLTQASSIIRPHHDESAQDH